MNQIDIYHEAPLQLFEKVQARTDGDYALVHLLDKDQQYAAKFIAAAATRGERKVILDNSAYELGHAYKEDRFVEWIEMLKPDIYVVPDSPGDAEKTIDTFYRWNVKRGTVPGRKMGVLQGKSVREIIECFNQLKFAGADIIGIPFLIGRGIQHPDPRLNGTPLSLMYMRAQLIEILSRETDMHPIHLLGVALPQEGIFYKDNPAIKSVDTSNPVLHGMFGTRYQPGGIAHKRSELLADLIHQEICPQDEKSVWYNVDEFRKMWLR